MNSIKPNFYNSAWQKYIPVIRILIKKSAGAEQVLNLNRIDFERAGGTRKSGYKFVVNFINSRTDMLYSGNDIVQSFIAALQDDEIIRRHLLKNNYTFTFTSKYQLQIKTDGPADEVVLPELEEELA